MRFAGRIAPGRGAGPFTGQRVSLIPDLIAETRARLSRLLRPLREGTVIAGGFTESAAFFNEVSTAGTTMGSMTIEPVGGTAGCASVMAHAGRNTRLMRPGVKRRITCILLQLG